MVSLALCSETVQIQRIEQRILVYFGNSLVWEIDLCAQRSTAVDRWAHINPCKESPDNKV